MIISVVTPSYNQGAFIKRTIRSVLDQSGDFSIEYFIADGGSTDDTIEIIKDYESRIKSGTYPIRCRGIEFNWVSEKDRGQADAVNKGILNTSGNIIAWINSDDIYYPNVFPTVATFFHNNPSALAAYGLGDHIDEKDRVIGPYPTEPWDYDRLFETCYLCQPGVFFRRKLINEAGLLDAGLQFCMDYELWLRYGRFTNFHYLRVPLAGSRFYDNTKTLGQTVAVHSEINDMFKTRFGYVPRRWIYTFARMLAQDIEKNDGSPQGNLDLVREVAQDAFLKWWGYIPSDELDYMDTFLSDPNTSQWQVKRNLQGLQGLRIGFDLGDLRLDAPVTEQQGARIADLLADRNPDDQFLVYHPISRDTADTGFKKNIFKKGLKNVHHVPVLSVDQRDANFNCPETANLAASLGFPDMVLVCTQTERKTFLERYPEFPEDRIRSLNLNSYFQDKTEEFAEKLSGVYEEVSRLPKRVDSTETGSIGLKCHSSDFIYRTHKKASLMNRTAAWFIRLAEKNASIKNRLKKVGFLKKLVKFARPRLARKFPDWV
ncbi:MAG: glycosyltransferase family 2 protein [Desulfomonilaceae bacterium]